MGIYADKKSKVSSKNSRKESSSSIYCDLPGINYQRYFKPKDNENSDNNSCSEARMKYLMENYKSIVHYNSSEPKKYGAKAFTKNSEIYIAPGEESALPHELAHVYQQKTQNIPATDEINGEKVNTDSKLEKEADQIAKHIEDYIPRIALENINNVKINSVMQFKDPDDEKIYKLIKEISKAYGIPDNVMTDEKINDIFRKYEENIGNYLFYREYRDPQRPEFLLRKEIENDAECQLYLDLEKSKKSGEGLTDGEKAENDRITKIMVMLSTEKIFEHATGDKERLYTLHEILPKLTENQLKKLKECILSLKDYCDAKGIRSILQCANKNDINVLIDFEETDEATLLRFTNYFIQRLELVTSYIEKVAKEKDSDEKAFGEKYWIRSTGSDPHKDGEHALFLVNKQNQEGHENDDRKKAGEPAKVYKPHDLSADAAVVGIQGIFSEINKKFKSEQTLKGTIIEGEDAFATMDIDVEHHTEEFVTKKYRMTQEDAQKYFFRAGMLKVITDAMAVIDLHQDNIMPTGNDGMIITTIIDAEIDFFQYINSGLENSALSKDTHAERIANSSFEIEGEEKRSGQLFSDKSSKYHQAYENGYNFMLKQTYENKDKFAEIYTSNLKGLGKIRIIPLATEELSGVLQSAITSGIKEENLNLLSQTLQDELQKEENQFIFSEKNKIEINVYQDKLKDAIIKTFNDGTIIAIYVDMNGNIYLDDKIIGRIISKVNEDTIIINNQVNKQQMIEIMKQSFLDVVEQLYSNSVT